MSTRSIRIGVAGCGYWGPNLVRNFAAVEGGELAAICDILPDRLVAQSARFPSAQPYGDFDTMLAHADLDAVVLATPSPTHFALAKRALSAGLHTYVEKPLTLESHESRELVELADRSGLTLMVGHLLKYHPAVDRIKQYVDTGELGQVRYIYTRRLNLGQVRHQENALWCLAPHDISLLLYLVDSDPVEVTANGGAYLQIGVEDVAFATVRFRNGVLGHMHVGWLDPTKARSLTVVGSRKMAIFDDTLDTQKLRLFDKGADSTGVMGQFSLRSGETVAPTLPAGEPLHVECQHFVDCVREGRQPLSDGRDGLRVVQTLEAAEQSLRGGGMPVSLSRLDGLALVRAAA